MSSWKPGAHWIFIVIGLALLVGAGAFYHFFVRLPESWPRVEAEVASSRVINPKGPTDYTPELAFRYSVGDRTREVTVVENWTSSSYDLVRSYVDGYPAGRRLILAVNPEDPEDVRHEIGATLMNLMVPGILAALGVVCTAAGFIAGRGGAGPSPAGAERARRSGLIFIAVGVVLLGIAVMLWRSSFDVRNNWPAVDATVLASRVVSERSRSSGTRPSRTMYDAEVTFRYAVDGVVHENTTRHGTSTSSRSAAEAMAAVYAPGTSHVINIRPDDPNIIRFDLGSVMSAFWPPLGLTVMALMFLTFGWRARRSGGKWQRR